ncbi:MAG TPA: hypothetical protein VMW45_02030 [Dehalococcoidia bacterium]|nr:hypothetical protein [Dehalococcoidia bacterium]
MLHVELVPDLSHCIETVAREEYEDMLKQLLGTGEANKGLQKRLEILKLFLQTADFKRLRTESEHYLLMGKKVKFVIYAEGGAPKYIMQVIPNSQDQV